MPDMETIRLFDTLSRELRDLPSGDNGRFRFYVCGPTVYGPAHIGNFLTFLRFDVLYRLLRLCGYGPYFVRNITDVDDKTIQRSRESGLELGVFTRRWTKKFHEDCALLKMLSPDVEPRATDHIAEQIKLVEALMENGHAYQGRDGSVYYRVDSFSGYGKLSHFDPESLRSQATNSAGSVNLADEYERDAIADFALWKAVREADGGVSWESPWGRGRPGWHLECSAMSMKYLGEAFDLHGGGEDLCFPHHENEIAQSEAATGKPFARHWMHSVHLLVEGKKMSKSLGNFFLLEDLLKKGFHPAEIRLARLGGPYRPPFTVTEAGLEAARSGLSKLESGVSALLRKAGLEEADWPAFVRPEIPADWGPFENAWKAFRNDLNTPAVLGALFNGLKRARKGEENPPRDALEALGSLLYGLGIELFARPVESAQTEVPTEVRELAERRWRAKQEKAYADADALRASLREKGWLVEDRPDGYKLTLERKDGDA